MDPRQTLKRSCHTMLSAYGTDPSSTMHSPCVCEHFSKSVCAWLWVPQVERLGRELLKQSTAFEQAGLDLEVLTRELELERRKNRDLPHEIRLAEAHKAEALEAKVSCDTV